MRAIRIYTTPTCPYCIAARELLDDLALPYENIDVQRDPDLRAKLAAENNGYRTVPMIFIGDEFIGGYTELAASHKRGDLLTKVNEA